MYASTTYNANFVPPRQLEELCYQTVLLAVLCARPCDQSSLMPLLTIPALWVIKSGHPEPRVRLSVLSITKQRHTYFVLLNLNTT